MATLKIWGRNNSVNVQKVLWCCEETALPYQRIDAGGAFGVVQSEAYRQLNPNGLVPTIVDDGLVLWESNAIVRYLSALHSRGKLWAEDARARASADCWMDWSNTVAWPLLRPLFLGMVRTPPAKRDGASLEESRIKVAEALAILDAHLGQQAFVAGDAFSMGDIPIGSVIWRWLALPIERPAMPNLQRWFDSLARRPAYAKLVMLPLT